MACPELIINFLPALAAYEKILNLKPFQKKENGDNFFICFFA